MNRGRQPTEVSFWLLIGALVITALIYLPGLFGTWLFDDYPNIVDNTGVHITSADLPNLVNAAMSSPASEFKRPLSSLSFAANYLATGLDPFWMKFTNLGIHLINGILVFILARKLLIAQELIRSPFEWKIFFLHSREKPFFGLTGRFREHIEDHASRIPEQHSERIPGDSVRTIGITATLVSICWMLLPINLTAVLYVVQREESMANIFVLLGLIGYINK